MTQTRVPFNAGFDYAKGASAGELQTAIEHAETGISWLDTEGIYRTVRPLANISANAASPR